MGKLSIVRDWVLRLSIISFLVVLCVLIGVDQSNAQDEGYAPWPMYGQNARHTGVSPYIGPVKDTVKWSYEFDGVIYDTPTIGPAGRIYISQGGKLYAFQPSGQLSWKYNFENSFYLTAPAVANDSTLLVGTDNGKLAAVDFEGKPIWTLDLEVDRLNMPPIIGPGNSVYFGAGNKLYKVDSSGNLKWAFNADGAVGGGAITTDTNIVFGTKENQYRESRKGTLYKINNEGEKKWDYVVDEWIVSSTTIGPRKRIYFGTRAGTLRAVNSNGELAWKYNAKAGLSYHLDAAKDGGAIYNSPAVTDSVLYVSTQHKANSSDSGFVHALYLNGTLKWRKELPSLSGSQSPTVDAAGNIYVGTFTSGLFKLSSSGNILWQFAKPRIDLTSAVISKDRTAYVAGADSSLYAIGGNYTDVQKQDPIPHPSQVKLSSNYPNPFNPTTTIPFSLPKAMHVKIIVYNSVGKKLKTLVDRQMRAGQHSVQFNANGRSSGIYFYKLSTNGQSVRKLKKMLLLK